MPDVFTVAVVGGGLAGLAASLALGQAGINVVNIAPAPNRADGRTTALLASSVAFLERLGVWKQIAPLAAPLATIVIIDATARLLRAPELAFHASEIGLDAFGYNIANTMLNATLKQACQRTGSVSFVESNLEAAVFDRESQQLQLSSGARLRANLVVGADGRSSAVRRLAAIDTRQWEYPQSALVLEFIHSLPHNNTSVEFHTSEGPFTFVPLGERRCGLVWVQLPAKAEMRMEHDKAALAFELERQMHSMLGKIEIVSPVQAWPLSGLVAQQFGKHGVVLVGEAAHVFAPIGAQGFNLGMRDVEMLAELAKSTPLTRLAAIGPEYHKRRAGDIGSRTLSVDLLNRSLLSDFLPVQMLRLAGLHAISVVGPLRRFLMREGVAPRGMPGFKFSLGKTGNAH